MKFAIRTRREFKARLVPRENGLGTRLRTIRYYTLEKIKGLKNGL